MVNSRTSGSLYNITTELAGKTKPTAENHDWLATVQTNRHKTKFSRRYINLPSRQNSGVKHAVYFSAYKVITHHQAKALSN